jgi:hypothetical protein
VPISSGVMSKDSLTFSGQNQFSMASVEITFHGKVSERDAQWDGRHNIPQYDSWRGDGNGFAQIDKTVNRFGHAETLDRELLSCSSPRH